MLIADSILTGRDIDDGLNAADRYFAMMIKPKSFSGKDNAELKYDRDFEKNCIVLATYANKPVKECSVKEYFSLISYYNDTLRDGRKSNPKGRYN